MKIIHKQHIVEVSVFDPNGPPGGWPADVVKHVRERPYKDLEISYAIEVPTGFSTGKKKVIEIPVAPGDLIATFFDEDVGTPTRAVITKELLDEQYIVLGEVQTP